MAGPAQTKAATDTPEGATDTVEVKLAHHLPATNPYTNKKQKPGDKLNVNYNVAALLANGGYLAVNPADTKAVRKMIGAGPGAASAAVRGGGEATTDE